MAQPKKIGGEIGEVRASIDVANLNAYIEKHVPAIRAPVVIKQFKFGQSNPTYFLTDASGIKFVLRKKPAGELISNTAHQVEREYTMLRALYKHNQKETTTPEQRVPVPEPIVLCEDSTVIGTPFYIMEYLDGRIFTDSRMPEVPPETRRRCWLSAIRSLAALSSLDPKELGLSSFGPTTPYFPRQIKSLARVSLAQAKVTDIETGKETGMIPDFEAMVEWYKTHLPDESKTGLRIVHGDYKLDNMIFHPTEDRVIGILDWELCTLGSPLADLANLTQPWSVDPSLAKNAQDIAVIIGFKNSPEQPADLAELEREYCRLMRQPYPLPGLVFARSWMLFRLAVIAQGIAARYARRQASSEKAPLYPALFPLVGNLAKLAMEEGGEQVGEKAKL